MQDLLTAPNLVSLLTLSVMEIVLGIDNVIFISILTAKLPVEKRALATRLGVGGALISRLGLLFTISWVMGLKENLFTVRGHDVSGRDLILLGGGLFLLAKASHEIYDKLEGDPEGLVAREGRASMLGILAQIVVLDIVFSLDSVITAVGMVDQLWIMVTAMLIAVATMLVFAQPVGAFVERHPSMKILALSFLLLIGVLLIAEGTGQHIPKGYVYFAMAFSVGIELLNMRFRKKRDPVALHGKLAHAPPSQGSR